MHIEHWATILFALAILHTFAAGIFKKLAHRQRQHSGWQNFYELLSEAEVVMLLWASALFGVIVGFGLLHWPVHLEELTEGFHHAIEYIESLNYTEPKFVVVIMTICATKPIVHFVDALIRSVAQLLARVCRLSASAAFLFSALTVGPLLGSFITEPAAMTVTAIVLSRQFFERGISRRLMYAIIGVLFVSVSIGGVLTHFAAPPVLMVAGKWGWGVQYMARHFGWKAVVAITLNTSGLIFAFRREISALRLLKDSDQHGVPVESKMPKWVVLVHLLALAFTVLTAHHENIFLGGFMLFLGFVTVTHEFQEPLKIRQALLVGGFLAGLVTLGGLQSWWLAPLLQSLEELPLFVGTTLLTGITDNAALTYLGSQVPDLSERMKQMLVAGAVAGGGLTVIANAPNPAGYAILEGSFKKEGFSGINPLGLLVAATLPTIVAALCFWYLPSL